MICHSRACDFFIYSVNEKSCEIYDYYPIQNYTKTCKSIGGTTQPDLEGEGTCEQVDGQCKVITSLKIPLVVGLHITMIKIFMLNI